MKFFHDLLIPYLNHLAANSNATDAFDLSYFINNFIEFEISKNLIIHLITAHFY